MTTGSNVYLPGQPIFGSTPSVGLGSGTYSRNGVVRASLVGPVDSQVGVYKLQTSRRLTGRPKTKTIVQSRAHPPSPSSLVIGHVIRLSPLQATISISVVDGLALPPGEDVRHRPLIAIYHRDI